MRWYPCIILRGETFNPRLAADRLCLHFRDMAVPGEWNERLGEKWRFGSGTLSPPDEDGSEESIVRLLEEYARLADYGTERLGIETAEFWLYVETLQSSFSVGRDTLLRICAHFDRVEFIVLQEE